MKLFSLAAVALIALTGGQLLASENFMFNNLNLAVPDGSASGVRDSELVSSGISQIGSIQLSLNISGNYNGDLYAYLAHGSALSVLLNRPGRTSTDAFGYDDCGFQITLSDTAQNGDIHTYRSVLTPLPNAPLTGAWQPDGRTSNPTTVLATDSRTAGLNVFNGMDANGSWTLFVADFSSGGTSTLNNWQLNISPVPEPSLFALSALGAMALAARRSRKG